MKTFKQFCEQAYNLQELDIKGTMQAASRNPLVRNPITKTIWKALGPVARAAGAIKAVSPSTSGPIGRVYGAATALTPPIVSGTLQTYDPTENPNVKKIDREISKQHTKAYQANPTGYTQMLGRSL